MGGVKGASHAEASTGFTAGLLAAAGLNSARSVPGGSNFRSPLLDDLDLKAYRGQAVAVFE